MALTRVGVPWEIATELSPSMRLGFTVAAGEISGATFNWRRMEWEKPAS